MNKLSPSLGVFQSYILLGLVRINNLSKNSFPKKQGIEKLFFVAD